MSSAHDAWAHAVQAVQRRQQGMDLWLGQVNCIGISDGRLLLEVPNRFTKDWISEKYLSSILEEMRGTIPDGVEVEFKLDSAAFAEARMPSRPPRPVKVDHGVAPRPRTAINSRFTFDAFVEGPTNQLALSACKAIASHADRSVSPVFVSGPSGLGKTHLLSAVYHEMNGRGPRGPVVFTSGEAFMNEFVESITAGRMQSFRERYRRDCGVLLVDDIQFIVSGDRTQEELFHVFNELYNMGRPIVITSDRPPRDLDGIEKRLKSRFEWGLIADIRPPDAETRIAITWKKAREMELELPEEVAGYVAQMARSSVREIEGALIRLDVQSSLSGQPITIGMAREALGIIAAPRSRKVVAEDVIRHVATSYGIKVSDIKGARRHRSVARPRQVAMYICRDILRLSYPEIGERFGGRDHSTVMNACRKISGLLTQDAELRSSVEALQHQLNPE